MEFQPSTDNNTPYDRKLVEWFLKQSNAADDNSSPAGFKPLISQSQANIFTHVAGKQLYLRMLNWNLSII